jgi:hypothetical protein
MPRRSRRQQATTPAPNPVVLQTYWDTISQAEILQSALKHQVSVEDIKAVLDSPAVLIELGDENRKMVMCVGFSGSGSLLEVGVVLPQGRPLIIHAMAARRQFIRLLPGQRGAGR